MKQKTQRWLLCVVVVLAMVAVFALAACNNTTYKATFVGGDGASGNPPAAIEGKADEEITLPQNTFQRAGHTFAGWNDGTKTYDAGAKYTLTKDVTFTAQWKENNFATAAFDGVLMNYESAQNAVQFVFTSLSRGNGRYSIQIGTPQDGLDGSYTISEEGSIAIYNGDDVVGVGSINGKTLTVSAKIGDEQTEVSATGDMYKITISANTRPHDVIVFVNAGAPLYPLLDSLDSLFDLTDATIEFNGEPFDVEAEEDAFSAGTGYTTMPAQESTVEIDHTGPKLHFALGDHAAAGAVAPKDLVVYGYGNTILHDAVEAEEGWVFAGWEQYNQGEATGRIYSAGSAFANSFVFEDVYFVAHYERANAISMDEVYVYFMDDDGNMLSIMEYFAVFATADEEVVLYFDYSEEEEGYTVIDCDDPSATDLQLYTTETTLEFRFTYDGQNYEYSIPLYKLTLRGEEEGEWLEFLTIYANEGCYVGVVLSGQGIVGFTYEGQSYEGEELENFEMPAKDAVFDVAFEEFDDVDLSQYEGTYVASSPFVIGGYSLNRIVITAADITAYTTDGDQLGLSYTVTGNDPDELLTDSLGEPFYLSFYSGGISVYTDGGSMGDFSFQEGEELTLDEYAGEWEFDPQSVEMGPKEFDGFKVEDGKIYFHSDGSYGDALTPSLSEEGGKVVATVQATQTWKATITFESATSASLEATDSLDTVSATCTKKGSAPAVSLDDYQGEWKTETPVEAGIYNVGFVDILDGVITFSYDGNTWEEPIDYTTNIVDGKLVVSFNGGLYTYTITFNSNESFTLKWEFSSMGGSAEFTYQGAIVTHTVTLKSDGTTVWKTVVVKDGQTLQIEGGPAYSDGTKTFYCWYDENDEQFDLTTPITSDRTLEASYRIRVDFDLDGGDGEQPEAVWASSGGSPFVSVTLPEADGYSKGNLILKGWSDGSTNYDPGTEQRFTQSTTLTAVWEPEDPNREYTVTYVKGYYTATGDAPASEQHKYGDTFNLPANTFTCEGYTFAGWQIGDDEENIKQPGEQVTMPAADLTIKATWEKSMVTVKFDPNGGEGTMANQQIEYGTRLSMWNEECTFTAPAGEVFVGWSLSASGEVLSASSCYWSSIEDYVQNDNGNYTLTLYAIWAVPLDVSEFVGVWADGSKDVIISLGGEECEGYYGIAVGSIIIDNEVLLLYDYTTEFYAESGVNYTSYYITKTDGGISINETAYTKKADISNAEISSFTGTWSSDNITLTVDDQCKATLSGVEEVDINCFISDKYLCIAYEDSYQYSYVLYRDGDQLKGYYTKSNGFMGLSLETITLSKQGSTGGDSVEGTKYEGNVTFEINVLFVGNSTYVFTEIVVANKDGQVELTFTYTVNGGNKITETVTATAEDTGDYSGTGTCVHFYSFTLKPNGSPLALYLAELENGNLEICNTSFEPYEGQFTPVEA